MYPTTASETIISDPEAGSIIPNSKTVNYNENGITMDLSGNITVTGNNGTPMGWIIVGV